ncbi:MAG: diguanylate cyclase [uncultured bacterium]|nr:MAG: diguanylate cyclase [uncultured bacterium]HCU71162.1 hypothetical protein [Candidatus Moranbacteria bacterium]
MGEQRNNFFVPTNEDRERDELIRSRARVDKLKETDNHYEDSIYDLATYEDEIRKDLIKEGIKKESLNRLANKFSDAKLGETEANKARWIDVLTGLRNRNAYKEEMPQLFNMEKRMGKDCSILMIDFDHFKKVNDDHGHLAGDETLRKITDLIRKTLRSSDIVFRYGGEEFTVFLLDATSLMAKEVAEKVRAAVEFQDFEITGKNGEKIILNKTVSIGVVGTDQLEDWSTYSESGAKEFLDEMTDRADRAAYASKEEGRNRVTLYSDKLKKSG